MVRPRQQRPRHRRPQEPDLVKKYLNTREQNLFDGMIRSVAETQRNENLEYIDDNSNTTSKHRVFEKNPYSTHLLRGQTSQLPDLRNDSPVSLPILGWTLPHKVMTRDGNITIHRNVFISPQELPPKYHKSVKHLSETIFPVIMERNEQPISISADDLRTIYNPGIYLYLNKCEKKIPLLYEIIIKNDRRVTKQELMGNLFCFYYELKEEKFNHHFNVVHRIVDQYRHPKDYQVIGMYAGGPIQQDMIFNGQKKERICVDISYWNREEKEYRFRTEISYDWRMRRVGYLCGLNSLFIVDETPSQLAEAEVRMRSLLRESTFVIADALPSFYRLDGTGSFQIRDPKKSLPLGPIIAVVTEGVSMLYLNTNVDYPLIRSAYYYLANGMSRPLLLSWIDFEKDFTPSEYTIGDPFVVAQHKLKQLMKIEEFWDYVVFEPNQDKNIGEEIVCMLESSPNFDMNIDCFLTDWHYFIRINDSKPFYYFYLWTQTLGSILDHGIFTRPIMWAGANKRRFGFDIDYSEFPHFTIEQRDAFDQKVQTYNHWWQNSGINQVQWVFGGELHLLYESCHCVLMEIIELRAPTINAIYRAIKNERILEKYKKPANTNLNSAVFRPYFNRFKQVMPQSELRDYYTFNLRKNCYYTFVMCDLPHLYQKGDRIVVCDKWDIYGLFVSTLESKKRLFHYLGTVEAKYECPIPLNDDEPVYTVAEHNVIPIIKIESGINDFWYHNHRNMSDEAKQMENNWKDDTQGRDDHLLKCLRQLNPWDNSEDTISQLLNDSYFNYYRCNALRFPDYWREENQLRKLKHLKWGTKTEKDALKYPNDFID